MPELRMFDLNVVKHLSPVSSYVGPEVEDSAIDDLIRFLLNKFAGRLVDICHVIPRVLSCAHLRLCFSRTLQPWSSMLVQFSRDFQTFLGWEHKNFSPPGKDLA